MRLVSRPASTLAGLWLGTVTCGLAQMSDSPFLPAGASHGIATGQPQDYELAGASVRSNVVQVCIFNAQTKHSHWIAVGASEDGIKVVSYNSADDRAIILVNGAQKSLSLRKTSVASFQGPLAQTYQQAALAPAPPAPLQAATPVTAPATPMADPTIEGKAPEVVKQERDARMLVSDLLEIGMAQRKAYEEAQKKAAATPAQPGGG